MKDVPSVIDAGPYVVRVRCPQCDGVLQVAASLIARLTIEEGAEKGEVRVRVKAKPVTHRCAQRSLFDGAQLANDEWATDRREDVPA